MNPTQIKARSRSSLRRGNFRSPSVAAAVVSSLVLLHFNGTDASTTIIDNGSSGATWSAVGNAQLDTAQKKLGSASLLLDGTGDYIKSIDIGNVMPATGGWTIDGWVRFNSVSVTSEIFSYVKAAGNVGIRVGHDLSASNKIWLGLSSNGSSQDLAAFTEGTKANFLINTDYHLELTRDDTAGAYYLYVDGVLDQTIVTATQITSGLDTAGVGALPTNGANPFNGWVDEFHIARSCLHPGGTTFTPPSAEYSS